jgi:CHAT domain-containing protein
VRTELSPGEFGTLKRLGVKTHRDQKVSSGPEGILLMARNYDEQGSIRQYLLNQISADEQHQIEQRLLTDDEFFDQLQASEDELVDQYLAGNLGRDEAAMFEKHFLITPERRQKLRFAEALRKYVATHSGELPQTAAAAHRRTGWRWNFVLVSPLRAAVFTALILVAAFGVWRIFFYQSDVDKGLIALNAAYHQQRPIQSRVSDLAYAPFSQTRGAAPESVNTTARNRAERILLDAAHDSPGAASYHALGQLYLTEKQFLKAIEQFNLALQTDPKNAKLHNDLGVAYLEQASVLRDQTEGGKALEALALSLEQLSKAVELNPSVLEALFNRALCLQAMSLTQQAREAWEKYLERDSSSQWSVEARIKLKLLDQQPRAKSPPQVLEDFLEAYHRRDDERAWQILSQTKEMITGTIVPFQITTMVAANQRKGEQSGDLISKLVYVGDLESSRAGDPFFAELAGYYRLNGALAADLLADAGLERLAGYQSLGRSRYDEALGHFSQSQRRFAEAHDEWEARMIDYWVASCYSRMGQLEESRKLANTLAQFSSERRYHWLFVQALSLVGGTDSALRDYSHAVRVLVQALDQARSIGDTYMQQKLLGQLVTLYDQLGDLDRALDCVDKAVSFHDTYFSSPRQEWRNYAVAIAVLFEGKLGIAAIAFGHEETYLATKVLNDPGIIHDAYLDLARLYGGTSNYVEAIKYARMSLDVSRSLPEEPVNRGMSAYSSLWLAHLLRQSGDLASALAQYDAVNRFYEPNTETGSSLPYYEARKGRLLCYVAMKDGPAQARELPDLLAMFEQHRRDIVEEQNRNSFFDKEQGVYDIAIEYAHSQANEEAAFNYSEASRARSLLETVTNHATTVSPTTGMQPIAAHIAKPLALPEIQSRMPERMQILQYSILPSKLLIWLITRESFQTREIPIEINDLRTQVHGFVDLASRDAESSLPELRERGKRLHQLLIGPVESLLAPDRVICIIPDKELNLLPYAALVSPETDNYLLSNYTLIYAPSSTLSVLFTEGARAKESSHPESLLSIGNPRFDHSTYADLPDLPAASQEAVAVSEFYEGSVPLVGEEASRQSFLNGMRDADAVHFAGHYLVDLKSPDSSKLLLAKSRDGTDDGALTMLDILSGKAVRPRIVILSACRTGLDRFYKGEGGIGIARAFLGAGVPIVVASLWPVDSDASSQLMIAFHKYRKQRGMPSPAALRQAQLDLAATSTRFQQPYYWAAFAPFGGYVSF